MTMLSVLVGGAIGLAAAIALAAALWFIGPNLIDVWDTLFSVVGGFVVGIVLVFLVFSVFLGLAFRGG